jgi:hypothetical protein
MMRLELNSGLAHIDYDLSLLEIAAQNQSESGSSYHRDGFLRVALTVRLRRCPRMSFFIGCFRYFDLSWTLHDTLGNVLDLQIDYGLQVFRCKRTEQDISST